MGHHMLDERRTLCGKEPMELENYRRAATPPSVAEFANSEIRDFDPQLCRVGFQPSWQSRFELFAEEPLEKDVSDFRVRL